MGNAGHLRKAGSEAVGSLSLLESPSTTLSAASLSRKSKALPEVTNKTRIDFTPDLHTKEKNRYPHGAR